MIDLLELAERVEKGEGADRSLDAEIQRGLAMDTELLKTMTKRVGCALRDKREKGIARVMDGCGMYQLWELPR